MAFQQTLKQSITLNGVGLHSGAPVQVTIRPAMPHHGVTFTRTDLPGHPHVVAHYKSIVNTQMATTLGRGQVKISTVEHLLAALFMMGVDNATIEVNGPEIPILDGSAGPYCEAILAVGVEAQEQPRTLIALRRRVEVYSGEKWAVAEPSSRLEILGSIEWKHPAIGYQEFRYQDGKTDYSEMANARTFGFLKDVEALKKMGLARGGSLENAIVLDEKSVLNPDGLRYKTEFARHKVLDALGDFMLAGIGIQGFVRLHKAGHDLHSQLLDSIFGNPDNFEIITGTVRELRRPGVRAVLSAGYSQA
ncbi:MAG: UDP-3-O-[3-hydroxymyristoyl] N-acetylglucosamine deacetylase [Bdellovibrionales bacterium GWB1_52_6]|nr:MAG: UDP-3-O-[3-hydroxymyristoyl] N-acetylglucosamine deacetylase [Bdellovibrionales bacterium GWB1_52_6]OFZ05742.1 MAG: UDP-3-O-[3-hydroxymyristoyl] N-acetylglucosamine deacetylase [Bdellovibrionales bacterium GWA1_52_35]HCM40318.1 UDP-3-O-[3-hydroxymyristoyl] N-acetylglucosamine deacetylase [Bdellovibrionales bacterium]